MFIFRVLGRGFGAGMYGFPLKYGTFGLPGFLGHVAVGFACLTAGGAASSSRPRKGCCAVAQLCLVQFAP